MKPCWRPREQWASARPFPPQGTRAAGVWSVIYRGGLCVLPSSLTMCLLPSESIFIAYFLVPQTFASYASGWLTGGTFYRKSSHVVLHRPEAGKPGKHCLLSRFSLSVTLPHPLWPPGGSWRLPNWQISPEGPESPAGSTAHTWATRLCSWLLPEQPGLAFPPGTSE